MGLSKVTSLTRYGKESFQTITLSEIQKFFRQYELFLDNLSSSLCSTGKIKLKVLW